MALYVSLLGVFVFTAMAAGLVVRALPLGAHARLSGKLSAGLLLVPVLAAIGLCACLLLPGLARAACHCVAHGLHHLHFCPKHPDYAHAMLLPASLGLMAWSALSLPRLGRLVLDILHTRAWSKGIARTAPRTVDGVRFHLVDAPELGACTTGLLRPLIAVDRRLWRTLDRAQRRAVLHHENGHKARLDPLTLVALRACAAICLVPEGNPLLKCWQARAEAECDRHAASTIADPEPVASALLALERFRWPTPPRAHAAAGGGDLAERVRALLDPEWHGARANLRNDFGQAFAIVLIATVAVVLPSGEQLHHAAETLLGGLFGH